MINPIMKKVFENRGYTEDYLYRINDPHYEPLADIDLLVSELKEIHDNQDVIAIYPDHDMDGVAAGCCGFVGLCELGFNARLFIPDVNQGYGITTESLDQLLAKYPDTKVIMTCDVGITAYEAAEYCRNKGIRFFVTDHHQIGKYGLIQADVVVDPMRDDDDYAHPNICGAFVMYQVLQRYADIYTVSFVQDQIRRLRVFAGMGTVSDLMPLLYENRQIVRDAIDICKLVFGDGTESFVSILPGCDVYKRAFWGIYEILKVYEQYGVIKDESDINESFFGFYLAPAVNSVKRMGGDLSRVFGAFIGNNRTEDAEYLYALNNDRKAEVVDHMRMIDESEQPYAPYVYYTTARPGIIGLIAQQLMSRTGLPCLVFAADTDDSGHVYFHGSGRSPEWYPAKSRLKEHFGDRLEADGHIWAFGCGVSSADVVAELFEFLSYDVTNTVSSVTVTAKAPDFTITTDFTGDFGIDIDLFREYLDDLDNFRPFGKAFPVPEARFTFRNRDVMSIDKKPGWEVMGKAKQHLKIHFVNGFDVVLWNQAYLITQQDVSDKHEVVGKLSYNEFNGVKSVIFVGDLVEVT